MSEPQTQDGPAMLPREGVVGRVEAVGRRAASIWVDTGAVERFVAGQFLSIDPHQFPELAPDIARLEAARGRREPRRCYSISSAPGGPQLAFTVKAEAAEEGELPPLLGAFLVDGLTPGRPLAFAGYSGRYVLPEAARARGAPVVHLVAGAGIAPNMAILEDDLLHGALRHTVVYALREAGDALFDARLAALAAAYPGRLRVMRVLSRGAPVGPEDVGGRVDRALLARVVDDPAAAFFLVCGPGVKPRARRAARARGEEVAPRFMEGALAALTELGVPPGQVIKESW